MAGFASRTGLGVVSVFRSALAASAWLPPPSFLPRTSGSPPQPPSPPSSRENHPFRDPRVRSPLPPTLRRLRRIPSINSASAAHRVQRFPRLCSGPRDSRPPPKPPAILPCCFVDGSVLLNDVAQASCWPPLCFFLVFKTVWILNSCLMLASLLGDVPCWLGPWRDLWGWGECWGNRLKFGD